jgi:CHAT domain-containing protein/pimeloyl-ACP methyl ester carboxylesterase
MATAKKKRRPRAHPPADYNLDEAQLRQQLLSGRNRESLQGYLGPEQYRELQALAAQAERRRSRGGPRVYVLPGIMGSKIGRERGGILPDDLLWVDPIEICAGRLMELALPRGNRFRALGVMLLAYLKLKLRLEIAGFDATFHPFDWRQNVDDLGRALHERVRRDAASRVLLVAHSMGGLVSRAAISLDRERKIERLVMLGTPNFGSFAPVQALRGSYPAVRKIAALDLRNTPEELARRVFTTFPGLHQMLPAPERFDSVDLYDPAMWPADGTGPTRALLKDVARARKALAPADDRFTLIAGVNQETVTSLARVNGSFEYRATVQGDGTVPLDFALLPECRTYYIEESHGSLPNNSTVAAATIDLLRAETTSRLPDEWRRTRAVSRSVTEAELRSQFTQKREWSSLPIEERRELLEGIVVPAPPTSLPVALPEALDTTAPLVPTLRFDQVVVARRRQRSIEVRLARGSITEASARALVLGIFRSVEPGGAAAAIDQRLNGAIKEFTTRRMFSGDAGEMFAMPTGRHLLRADTILFAGLGAFDRFTDDVQQFVAENVVRTFVRTQVEDFATVLWGANSGLSTAQALTNQLRGYFKGLLEVDADQSLRRITLCEFDPVRFDEMKAEIFRLSATGLFADVQVTFDEVQLPEVSIVVAAAKRAQVATIPRFGYVIVNQEHASADRLTLRSSVLTAGAHACVISESQVVPRAALERHLKRIETSDFTKARLRKYGNTLADLTIHPSVAEALAGMQDNHIVVVHDAAASRIPWETICIGDWFPAGGCGLSRRFASEGLSVAKWSESRRLGTTLDVLLVVNPTADLAGAELEGERLEELLKRDHGVRLTVLKRRQATRARITQEIRSGAHDVLHYAGHAHFDPVVPSRSGITLSDGVLSGAHLASLGDLPALMFFNACESARIRGGKRARKPNPRRKLKQRIDENVGLAESFLRGGAANYVGTYWPVGDDAAESFSTTLYGALVEGQTVGEALNRGRKAVEKLGSVDWADYIHYGSYDFTIKVK